MRALTKLKRRVFHIKIPNEAKGDIEKFLERLSDAIKSYGGVIRFEKDSLRVEIYGDGTMIRNSWIRIRNLLKEYKSVEVEKGLKEYSLKRVYREIGLAIPSDVLEEVLRARGYRVEVKENSVISDADFETIVSVASDIKNALEELKFVEATRTAKKLIAAISSITGRPISDIINEGINAGIFQEENDGKISVISPWREVLKKLARVLEDEQST